MVVGCVGADVLAVGADVLAAVADVMEAVDHNNMNTNTVKFIT